MEGEVIVVVIVEVVGTLLVVVENRVDVVEGDVMVVTGVLVVVSVEVVAVLTDVVVDVVTVTVEVEPDGVLGIVVKVVELELVELELVELELVELELVELVDADVVAGVLDEVMVLKGQVSTTPKVPDPKTEAVVLILLADATETPPVNDQCKKVDPGCGLKVIG